jgi:hypothetical protein
MDTKHRKLNKIFLIVTGVLSLLLLLFLTDPNKLPLPFLIVPFLLLGFIIYHSVRLILILRAGDRHIFTSRLIPLSLAFFTTALFLLESLNQLTWKDTLLVGAFSIMFWLYVWRADFLK